MAEASAFPITLDELIRFVHVQNSDSDALGHLQTAMAVSDGLDEQADHLIGHFVDQARRAGASWTAIGSSMGVSKQAAQQRSVITDDLLAASKGKLFARFTPRARDSIVAARTEAHRLNASQVGTEHILLGLLGETDGIAAHVLAEQGVTLATARPHVPSSGEPTTDAPRDRIRFAPSAKQVIKLALRESLRRGHNYIGTEHLLVGVVTETDALGAQVLRELEVDTERLQTSIDAALAGLGSKNRPRPPSN
jgi:hypothetical protein